MAALIRLFLFMFVVQALFFVLLRIYVRSLRTERLEHRWDRKHPDQAGDSPARRAFIARSMQGFERSLKARLTWLVFVLPTVAMLGIIYWINWR
ncbi:hypothetical protein [Paracoccus sp. (in: a-proteobacteria)]|uniref:hypothetical protein n=1 Tax=Paracoccus sp. TaxID=267 RepID=UPI0026E0CDE1|nr:hypothetical protein [Paracoccus sp. (in: a-proteobacteria)]MDO5646899.1 hypothetical protein [Paracoccus sp. (in: a-proteobacteria)]